MSRWHLYKVSPLLDQPTRLPDKCMLQIASLDYAVNILITDKYPDINTLIKSKIKYHAKRILGIGRQVF